MASGERPSSCIVILVLSLREDGFVWSSYTPVIGQIGEKRLELLATAGDSAKGYTIEFSDIRNSPRISILDQRNKGRNYNEVQESRQNRDECNESGNRRSCLTAVVALSG